MNTQYEQLRSMAEDALAHCLPAGEPYAKVLTESAAYSLMAGGKRLRPVLVIATNAEAEIISPTMIKLEQDGKTMFLKLKTKALGEAKIWPEHKYYDFESRDNGLRRVGFVMQLKAGQSVDVEVSFSPEKGKGISLPKLNLGRRNK